MATKVTKDMIITDILDLDNEIITILSEYGLHCVGCWVSYGETLEEACEVHDIDMEALLADLNEYLEIISE